MKKINIAENLQMFASKNTSFSDYNVKVSENKSSLAITIYFSANNSSTYFYGGTLYCTCNGVTKSQTVNHPVGSSTSATFYFDDIEHNSDGSKTVSWNWNCNTGTYGLGNISDSGSYTLTKINRGSIIDLSQWSSADQNIENIKTVPIIKYVQSYYHKLIVRDLQNTFSVQRTGMDGGNYSFQFTTTELNTIVYPAVANKTSTVLVFELYTYTNSSMTTLVQELISTSFYGALIENANPEMEIFSVEANDNATKTLMDWTNAVIADNGKIIQAKTQVKLNLGAVTLKKGATFKKYTITASGNSYETTSNSYVITGGLSTNGNIIVTAEDSRGNTVNRSFAYTLTPYADPIIANESIDRLNYPNGNQANLKFNAKIAKLMKDKGQYNIKYKYKKTTESTYGSLITLSPSSIDSEGNITFDKTLSEAFENGSTYDLVIYVNDYFNSSTIYKNISLNKEAPELWIGDETVAILGLPPDGYEKNALYFKGELLVKWTDE